MFKLNLNSQQLIYWLFGFAILFSMSPYFIWHSLSRFYLLFVLSLALVLVINFRKFSKIKNDVFISLLVFSALYLYLELLDLNNIKLNSTVVLTYLLLLISYEGKIKIFDVFAKIYAFLIVCAIPIIFLIFIGADLPFGVWETNHSGKAEAGLFYHNYIIMVVLSNQIFSPFTGEIIRFGSVFDEPGVVGTISLLILSVRKFDLSNKENKIIFFGGLLSFSFAFYLGAMIYLALLRPKFFLKFVFVSVVLLALIYDELSRHYFFNAYILDKFTGIASLDPNVNNRAGDCWGEHFKKFLYSANVILGNGPGAHTLSGCNLSHVSSLMYNYGLVGVFLISVFYISLVNFKKGIVLIKLYQYAIFLFIFLLMIYQRPAVLSPHMIIIFIAANHYILGAGSESIRSPIARSPVRTLLRMIRLMFAGKKSMPCRNR